MVVPFLTRLLSQRSVLCAFVLGVPYCEEEKKKKRKKEMLSRVGVSILNC